MSLGNNRVLHRTRELVTGPAYVNECTRSVNHVDLHRGTLLFRAAILLVTAILSVRCATAQDPSPSTPLYPDASQPIDVRVNDLMSRMTLEEKIGQLNLPCVYVDELGKTIPEKIIAARKFAAGTYTTEIGPGAGFFTLLDTLKHGDLAWQVNYLNELQKIALTQTRLKIPLLEDEEGTHGAMFPGATIYPEGLSIGSTFDMPLVHRIYSAEAAEARSVGIHVLSTLVLELDRDPRMGRNMEAYTEDPYLYAQIAKNIVSGAQGQNINAPDKVAALMTDFPTQSEPASGLERGAIESPNAVFERITWCLGFLRSMQVRWVSWPDIRRSTMSRSMLLKNGTRRSFAMNSASVGL